jgi:hypothetical protein
MIGIIDLAKIETEGNGQLANPEKDTWVMRLPQEVCRREGFAAGTLVSLTIKDGGIKAHFILPPAKNIRDISRQILAEDRELYQRLKEIGD